MQTPDQTVKERLNKLNISYQEFHHPPVYTVEESQRLCPPMPGIKEKNLFLRDKKGKTYYLVCLPGDKQLNLKEMCQLLGVRGLSFASERRLKEVLAVEPGSVGILALVNDTEHLTTVYIDQDLMNAEWFQSHPLINTSTICFKTEGLPRFLEHTGHSYQTINL